MPYAQAFLDTVVYCFYEFIYFSHLIYVVADLELVVF